MKPISKTILHCIAGLGLMASTLQAATAVQYHGQLKVSGNQILNSRNESAVLAGMSLYWSHWKPAFYTAQTVSWLATDWHANVVRAALAVGASDQWNKDYLDDPTANKARVKAVVDAAIANGIYVIIDWHSHTADQQQSQAVSFFTEMAQTYGSYPNVIYEVFNEPTTQSWSTVKNYSTAVIAAIRAKDPDNLILVGSPSWDQRLDLVAADPITNYSNIAYTFHFYSGTHKTGTEGAKVQTALNKNLAVFISEWGTSAANGDGGPYTTETDTWLNWAAQRKLSWCNWSIANLTETSAALNSGTSAISGWNTGDLSTSGNYVRNKLRAMNPAQNGYSAVSSSSSVSSSSVSSSSSQPSSSSSVVNSTSFTIPGKIEAESFSAQTGTTIEATSDAGGGSNLGYIDNGDWTEYKVNVTSAGNYAVNIRVATSSSGGSIQILWNNQHIGTAQVTSTGGWQAWTTVTTNVSLTQGQGTLRLNFQGSGTGLFNLNYLQFHAPSPVQIDRKQSTIARFHGNTLQLADHHDWKVMQAWNLQGQLLTQVPVKGLGTVNLGNMPKGPVLLGFRNGTDSYTIQHQIQ